MPDLAKFLDEYTRAIAKRWAKIEAERQRKIERFELVDLLRAGIDPDYKKALDDHFGKGWEERVRWDFYPDFKLPPSQRSSRPQPR